MVNIAPLVKQEHVKLGKLWQEFLEEYKKDVLKSRVVLDQFKWQLQKHFLMEELGIYELSQSIKGEEVSTIFDLMEDHGSLRSLLLELDKDLSENSQNKISDFRTALDKHENFEDNNFYPMLDEYLNDNQKLVIVNKIKEKLNSDIRPVE